MTTSDQTTIGYYTVVEDERTGWTGGLLLLNDRGRPLEFQCTLPVRPSRAHEILHGAMLGDYLIGELIAPLLVAKCRTPISLLCCDQPEALRIAGKSSFPVALIDEAAEPSEGPISDDSLAHAATAKLAGSTLRFDEKSLGRVSEVIIALCEFPDAVEPFERIREAIKEAHSQIARAQPEQVPPPSEAA